MRPAGITSLGVKMYRKETAVYTQREYLWAWARSERRGKRQKEAIGMDAASGSGLGRSTNRPTIEPSDRPVRNGRSTLLLTVRTNGEQERGRREKIAEQERRDEGSNRERERAALNTVVAELPMSSH